MTNPFLSTCDILSLFVLPKQSPSLRRNQKPCGLHSHRSSNGTTLFYRLNISHLFLFHPLRPLWLLLVLGMAVGLGTTLFNQVSSYYDYPIRTVTKVEINSELAFPAVTICNLNQFVRERVPDIPIVRTKRFVIIRTLARLV